MSEKWIKDEERITWYNLRYIESIRVRHNKKGDNWDVLASCRNMPTYEERLQDEKEITWNLKLITFENFDLAINYVDDLLGLNEVEE